MTPDAAPAPPLPSNAKLRGTQTLVDQMGWVFHRPRLIALQVVTHWAFGLPLLELCYRQALSLFKAVPPQSTALANLDVQNPWVAATQLVAAGAVYAPYVLHTFTWLVPLAAVAWIVISSLGRSVVLARIVPGTRMRPLVLIPLQAAWLALLALVCGGWLCCMQWLVATHIATGGEPDLIGFAMGTIILSLGFFTMWALVSWPLEAAPVLAVCESLSAPAALAASVRLGRPFSSKLVETNLVMGIVTLALIVLSMVLSAAPVPFSDLLGPSAMHTIDAGAVVFFFIASDFFELVRLKGMVEFRNVFRG